MNIIKRKDASIVAVCKKTISKLNLINETENVLLLKRLFVAKIFDYEFEKDDEEEDVRK